MSSPNPTPTEAGPRPPFKKQEQSSPGLESEMDPKPDYGLESYKGHGRLENQVALITGADSGIGRAVAWAFACEGADVAIAYWNEHSDAQEIKSVIESRCHRKVHLIPCDLSIESERKRVIDETIKAFKHIDILVNNAAFQGKSKENTISGLDYERVRHTFEVNIISMFSLVRYAIPHLRKGGTIINTGSVQAYSPSAQILDYATTKGAIVAFTKGLAAELTGNGIRVNCVAPGPVWTPLVVASFPAEKIAQFGSNYPIKRPAQPAELAPAYVFLASQDSKYISGEILAVTGGEATA